MVSKGAVAALVLSQMLVGVGFAQSVTPRAESDASVAAPNEFGRVSGGEIDLITKRHGNWSGSLGVSRSRSQLPLAIGRGPTNGYEATLGGTVLQDRLWFFASAQQNDSLISSRFATPLAQSAAPSRGIDAKITSQIGERQSLITSFAAGRQPGVTTAMTLTAPNSASFLSLHYTGVVSNSMFFSSSFSQHSAAQTDLPLAGFVQPR